MWRFLKRLWSCMVTLVCVVVVGSLVWASNLCKLKDIDGKRAFYLYSASSQAKRVETLRFEQLFSVKGESVRFAVTQTEKEGLIEELFDKYDAELVCTEYVDGVTSYYAVTPRWNGGVVIDGKTVNLHVAIGDKECVVGTPIIFGGF